MQVVGRGHEAVGLFGAFVECLSATWYDVCAESLEFRAAVEPR